MKHKFFAKQTEVDKVKFHSKAEARRYTELKVLKKAGQVIFFLRQTPFHLDGNVKYLCDFMIFWSNGEITFEDVKGCDTPLSLAKRKMVEAAYPIRIEVIK
jgi:hypothetical protein